MERDEEIDDNELGRLERYDIYFEIKELKGLKLYINF